MNKILFIMHMPPPVHGASMVGKYIHDSKRINKEFKCHYINLTTAKDLQDIGKLGIKKFFSFLKLLRKIRNEVKSNNPNVIYITPNAARAPFYKDWIVMMYLKLILWHNHSNEAKIVAHYHNKGIKEFASNPINNWLYKIFFRNLHVIFLAEQLKCEVKDYINHENIWICPNGIPDFSENEEVSLERLRQEESKTIEEQRTNNINILFLSNMMEEKGVWTLIDACKILKNHHVDFTCNFVGGWKDIKKEHFESKVDGLKLNDCIFAHGAKYGNDKEEFFERADVMVFPTYYHNECFPLVLLEGMKHRLACISTNEAGIPSIIDDNKTGFLINAKNHELLATKIEELAKNREKCLQFGINGYNKYKKYFTLTQFEENMTKILKHIASSR